MDLPPSSSQQITGKMSSIKQVIIAAINKVSSAPEYAGREYTTADDAREDFIRALIAELFPESNAVSTQEVVVPVVQQVSPSKTPERKATKEEKAAAKAAKEAEKAAKAAAKEAEKKAKEEAKEAKAKTPKKSPEEKAAEKEAAKAAKEAAKEAEKKAKAEAKEAEKAAKAAEKALKVAEKVKASPKASPEEKKEAKAAAKEAEKAAKAAAKEAEKAAKAAEKAASKVPLPSSPKPKATKKAKAPEGANLPKIDPTWRKHLKKADKDHAKELEPALLTYLNAMTAEEFNSKTAEEHVAAFLTKKPEAQEGDGKVETDLEIVEFEGKEYFVNPETKRVYEGEGVYDEEAGWTNYKPVGYVGMAAFAEMKLDA
jgi:hypothetical protein